MKVLIIAEHDNQHIKSETLNTISAGKQLCENIDLLIVGHNCESAVKTASTLDSVKSIKVADNSIYEHQLAENVSKLIAKIAPNYSHILFPATSKGKDILPRVAALLDVNALSDVTEIVSENTFKRPIYAGNAIATVLNEDTIKLLSIRASSFDPALVTNNEANIEALGDEFASINTQLVSNELSQSDRPELASAKIVVSGGRGLGSAENFDLVYKLAEKLNAAVGASRAAVDSGYVSNDMQVGQTGKIVAPDAYFAIGISGAIQHLAGMKDSKIIVAINKDEEAPIFQVADYGLVADLFDVLPELTAKL